MPTSETPPAVYHQHGSATGAFPGVVATSVGGEHQKAERIGSMTGMVIGGANKDEILDAFDGKTLAAVRCACWYSCTADS